MRFLWRACYRDGSSVWGWTPGEIGWPTSKDWNLPNLVRLEVYSKRYAAPMLALDIPPGAWVFCRMRSHIGGNRIQYGIVAVQKEGHAPDVWFLVDGKAEYQHGFGGAYAWAVEPNPWEGPANAMTSVRV